LRHNRRRITPYSPDLPSRLSQPITGPPLMLIGLTHIIPGCRGCLSEFVRYYAPHFFQTAKRKSALLVVVRRPRSSGEMGHHRSLYPQKNAVKPPALRYLLRVPSIAVSSSDSLCNLNQSTGRLSAPEYLASTRRDIAFINQAFGEHPPLRSVSIMTQSERPLGK